jgi:hypothetical protein
VQVVDVVEQALAPAEQRRHQVKLHLVDQTGVQVLLRGPRTTRQRDILTSRSKDPSCSTDPDRRRTCYGP